MKVVKIVFKTLTVILLLLLLILAVTWGMFPYIAAGIANQQLKPYHLEMSDQSKVNFNPFLAKFTVDDLKITSDNTVTLSLNSLEVDFALKALLNGEINFQRLSLSGVYIKIIHRENQLIVAGIPIPPSAEEQKNEKSTPSSLLVHSPLTELEDITLEVDLESDSKIRRLRLQTENLTLSDFSLAGMNKLVIESLALKETTLIEKDKAELVHWDNLAAEKVNLSLNDNEMTLSNLVWEKIRFSTLLSTEEASKPLASLESLTTDTVTFSENQLYLPSIYLLGLDAIIEKTQEGKLANLADLDFSSGAASEAEQKEPVEKEKVSYSIQSIFLSGSNNVSITDKSVSPVYAQKYQINTVEIGNIDSNHITHLTPLKADLLVDEFSRITLEGNAALFSEAINGSLKANVSELSLPKISPYMSQVLGIEIKAGQLDTDLNVLVENDEINGKVSLGLRGTDLSSADQYQKSSLKDQAVIPLNVALGMLKDGKGDINLNIPLSGRADDPSFGINSFIHLLAKKAIMKATTSYLMKTFVPYANVISVAKSAGEYALKLRFENLPYAPGEIKINEAHTKYVEQFTQLMKDKPKTVVKVCGVATHKDIGSSAKAINDDASLREKVANIAEKRQKAFKEYVVSTGNIESSRILLCSPQLDLSDGASPRIEIKI